MTQVFLPTVTNILMLSLENQDTVRRGLSKVTLSMKVITI